MESTLEQKKATVPEQRVAVITGASQGIGAALVKAYRDRNYRVVATARSVKPSRMPVELEVRKLPSSGTEFLSDGVDRPFLQVHR